MKIILIGSIAAMISAGIYGTIDLAVDVKKGTLIQYEDENAPEVKQFAFSSKRLNSEAQNVHVAKKEVSVEKKLEVAVAKINNWSDLKFEDFSRGELIDYRELMLVEEPKNDSIKTTAGEITPAPKDSVMVGLEIPKEETKPVELKERKLSLSLYSRGRSPRLVKTESDSAKKVLKN